MERGPTVRFTQAGEKAFTLQHLASLAFNAHEVESYNYLPLQSQVITLPNLSGVQQMLDGCSAMPTCTKLLVSGINVSNSKLRALSFIIPKKLSPEGSHGARLQRWVFCPVKQGSDVVLLVDI